MPRASNPSLPGRMGFHRSALAAVKETRFDLHESSAHALPVLGAYVRMQLRTAPARASEKWRAEGRKEKCCWQDRNVATDRSQSWHGSPCARLTAAPASYKTKWTALGFHETREDFGERRLDGTTDHRRAILMGF